MISEVNYLHIIVGCPYISLFNKLYTFEVMVFECYIPYSLGHSRTIVHRNLFFIIIHCRLQLPNVQPKSLKVTPNILRRGCRVLFISGMVVQLQIMKQEGISE